MGRTYNVCGVQFDASNMSDEEVQAKIISIFREKLKSFDLSGSQTDAVLQGMADHEMEQARLRENCTVYQKEKFACFFCDYGHNTECHYPKTCKEANCSHHQLAELEAKHYG